MRTLVIIPTYNERENVGSIVGRVRASVPDAEVLIVDDGSPDGTGELADALAATDASVHVMHRAGKDGLGAAYRAGMSWALESGYSAIVEMDADGSHQPEQLPRLLAALRGGAAASDAVRDGDLDAETLREGTLDGETARDETVRAPGGTGADVVLGSRWVAGGGVVNWPAHRRLISRGGSAYSRLALGLPVRDVTGGYRAFTADALRQLHYERTESQGYCFQIDMTRRAYAAGLDLVEVPITFVERERGASKMGGGIVVEAMLRVTLWGLTGLPQRFRKRSNARTVEPMAQA